jgi:hypothetical protein
MTAATESFHQEHRTAALDFARDLAVHVGRHSGDAARQNFAAFGNEFSQEIGVLVVDRFDGDVDPAPRHGAIGTTKSGTAFGSFWLHRQLLGFAMKGVPFQERIIFLFFEPVGGAWAFLVARRHVTRNRLAERFRLGAFQNDNFLSHRYYSFAS